MKAKKQVYLTDFGTAREFQNMHKNDVRWTERGWLIWDDTCWKFDNEAVSIKAHDTVRKFQKDRVENWQELQMQQRMNAMMEQAKPYLKLSVSELDKHPYLLNVKNGVVDLRTGKLKEHNRNFYMTQISDVTYDPKAKCPKWLKFMEFLFPDAELRKYIQKMTGYLLTGYIDEKCLLFLLGSGDNGKTVFVKVIESLMGDYSLSSDLDVLLSNRYNSGLTPHLDRFPGKRLVTMSEVEAGRRFNAKVVNRLTGGDVISVNPKHGKVYEFNPTHKIIIFGNNKPAVSETADGFWNRLRLIEFDKKIEKSKQKKMSMILKEFELERSAILNWMIEGELLRHKEKMNAPKQIQNAVDEYRSEEDMFTEFFNLYYKASPADAVMKNEVLAAYNEYLKENGITFPAQQRYVGNRLKQMSIQQGGAGKQFYIGIRKLKFTQAELQAQTNAEIANGWLEAQEELKKEQN